MKHLPFGTAVASALLAVSAAPSLAEAAPVGASAANAIYIPGKPLTLESVQYFYGGRRYCWYDNGWRGPGYYWCGYGARYGLGWGGGLGWRGWGGGPRYYGGYHRGYVGHGGGYHGGGGHYGGGHGGGGHVGGGHVGGGHGGGGHAGGGGHGGGHHH